MAKAIAYGSITILDLIDTSTSIYYADKNPAEDNSAVIKTVPVEGDFVAKYIGIYNGLPINLLSFDNASFEYDDDGKEINSRVDITDGVIERFC
jgi:hypothetical protein